MFKRISHAREHLKVHSGDRPYKCTLCHKNFKSANACKVHLRTHEDVLSHKCYTCGKQFREKSGLDRHERIHTGIKPFVCKHCGRGFSEQGTLSRHYKAKVPCTSSMRKMWRMMEALTPMKANTDALEQSMQGLVPADTSQVSLSQEDSTFGVGKPPLWIGDNIEIAPSDSSISLQSPGVDHSSSVLGSDSFFIMKTPEEVIPSQESISAPVDVVLSTMATDTQQYSVATGTSIQLQVAADNMLIPAAAGVPSPLSSHQLHDTVDTLTPAAMDTGQELDAESIDNSQEIDSSVTIDNSQELDSVSMDNSQEIDSSVTIDNSQELDSVSVDNSEVIDTVTMVDNHGHSIEYLATS